MSSFGAGDFVGDLRAAVDSTDSTILEYDDFDEEYENDLVQDGLATQSVSYTHPQPTLMPVPQPTQTETQEDEEERPKFDDRQLELNTSMYSTLTAQTKKVKQLKRDELELNMEHEDAKPFQMLDEKHEEINAMTNGPDKTASVQIYNTIGVLFNKARHAPQLREFLATLFAKTEAHYSFKEKKKALKLEIAMMEHLRDQTELEDFMAKQKKRSQQETDEVASSSKRARKCARVTCSLTFHVLHHILPCLTGTRN